MRLPLAIPLDARDGLTDQDGRMTNVVAEVYEDKTYVLPRPGLSLQDQFDGGGSGIVCFDGAIISLWGATIDYGTSPMGQWSSLTTYDSGDVVFFDGTFWVSVQGSNTNNTPSYGSSYWKTAIDPNSYDNSNTYEIGDSATVAGVTYYALTQTTGYQPPNLSRWSTTQPGVQRYYGYFNKIGWSNPGPISATPESAARLVMDAGPYNSCATRDGFYWFTFLEMITSSSFRIQQWQTTNNCASSQTIGTTTGQVFAV